MTLFSKMFTTKEKKDKISTMFTDSFNILCVDATTFSVDGCLDFESEMLPLGVSRSEWTQKLIRN